MWRIGCLSLLGLGLIGCVSGTGTLPRNGAPIAPACYWPVAEQDTQAYVRRAVAALEAEEFRITDVDLNLGLIDAERQRVLAGYSSAGRNGWPRSGFFGWFGSRGGGIGVGLGAGGFGGYAADPLREEQLTLLIDDAMVRLSRNIRIVETDGWVRTHHDAASDAFCRELRQSIEAQPVDSRAIEAGPYREARP